MTNSESDSQPASTRHRGSKVKKASVGATVLLVIGYLIASWLGIPLDGLNPRGPTSPPGPERPVAAATDGQATVASPIQIENVSVRNLNDKIVFRGTVDLTPTMQRIDAGRLLDNFRNDGSTFQNRERRLPIKERGYYKEYVHPTPKLGGPGPQRVVTGKQGEAYYTFDHYETFQKIR